LQRVKIPFVQQPVKRCGAILCGVTRNWGIGVALPTIRLEGAAIEGYEPDSAWTCPRDSLDQRKESRFSNEHSRDKASQFRGRLLL
jgi:hypothetical protein